MSKYLDASGVQQVWTATKTLIANKASKPGTGYEGEIMVATATGDIEVSGVAVDGIASLSNNNSFDGEQEFNNEVSFLNKVYANGDDVVLYVHESPSEPDEAASVQYVDDQVGTKYSKPDDGIPESDLDASVQAKLNSSSDQIYVTVYDEDTYENLAELYDYGAGKTIFCRVDDPGGEGEYSYYLPLTYYEDGGCFQFSGITRDYVRLVTVTVDSNDIWTLTEKIAELATNKITTLTSSSTDSQYISAKCAYTAMETEVSARTSADSAEATARSNADTTLTNTKQNNLNTLSGWSSSNNIVLVSMAGTMQWKVFNNILAGSTTPISSEGDDGDVYVQTQ